MNKQRKVLITITYNEMGIIIDTKAEEVAQPNLQPTCNQLATTERDLISRQAVLDKKELVKLEDGQSFYCISPEDVKALPPVTPQPKTGQEPKTGHWIVDGPVDCYLDKVRCHCSECGKKKEFPANYDHIKQEVSISYKNPEFIDNYCPNCGAKMQEVEE